MISGDTQNDITQIHVDPLPPDLDRPEPKLRLMNSTELDAADLSVEWYVEGLLIKGQPMIVGGMSKTMKTSLLVDMAISIATGGRFLNEFNTEESNVLFISGESGLATLRSKARVICDDRGLKLEDIGDSLHWCDTIPTITSLSDLEELENIFAEHKISVLILDPLYLSLGGGDELNNVMAQGEKLRAFAMLCQKHGVTAILCHHAKKTIGHSNPLGLNDLAGAGFQEFARQWFLINRRADWEHGVHRLWLTWGGSFGHGRTIGLDIDEGQFDETDPDWRQWELTTFDQQDAWAEGSKQKASAASERKEIAKQNAVKDAREKILKAFVHLEGKATKPKLAEAAGMGKGGVAFNEAVGELLREGELKQYNITGANGKEYDGLKRVYKGSDHE